MSITTPVFRIGKKAHTCWMEGADSAGEAHKLSPVRMESAMTREVREAKLKWVLNRRWPTTACEFGACTHRGGQGHRHIHAHTKEGQRSATDN